jgi:hypothetical protein
VCFISTCSNLRLLAYSSEAYQSDVNHIHAKHFHARPYVFPPYCISTLSESIADPTGGLIVAPSYTRKGLNLKKHPKDVRNSVSEIGEVSA